MKLRRMEIECNDDGTFQVELYIEKPRKDSKDGEAVPMDYDTERKKFSMNSLSELEDKVSSMTGKEKSVIDRYFGKPEEKTDEEE